MSENTNLRPPARRTLLRWRLGLVVFTAMIVAIPQSEAPAAVGRSSETSDPLDPSSELGAIHAELQRGLTELRLEGSPAPYFAEMRMVRARTLTIRGSYGGIVHDLQERQAFGSVAVWVGGPERDNSSFFGGAQQPGFVLPMEPDARGTRRSLWRAMDQGFRVATQIFASKQTAMARSAEEDPPWDRAKPPTPVIEVRWNDDLGSTLDSPVAETIVEREAYRDLVAALSRRFKDHIRIDGGEVVLQVFRTHESVVNTQGIIIGETRDRAVLSVLAQTQAADGMQMDHSAALHLSGLSRFDDSLRHEAEQMVDRVLAQLEEQIGAPMLEEDYDGPILFSGTAAAQLLATTLAVHVAGTPAPMSEFGRVTELEPHWLDRLGREVMPKFIDVVDDPTLEGFGHYRRDAQGYIAQSLTLVKEGRLSRLLMTRTPNAVVDESNGRARTTPNLLVGPSISNLAVHSRRPGLGEDAMVRALLDRAADDGYEFAYVVEALRDPNILGVAPRDSAVEYGSGRKISLPLPVQIYRVELDKMRQGRRVARITKTLVRGALFSPVSMRVLRRIREVGEKTVTVPMRMPPGMAGGFNAELGIDALLSQSVDVQISTPALLIEGMELLIERGEHERLPTLTHPLRRD